MSEDTEDFKRHTQYTNCVDEINSRTSQIQSIGSLMIDLHPNGMQGGDTATIGGLIGTLSQEIDAATSAAHKQFDDINREDRGQANGGADVAEDIRGELTYRQLMTVYAQVHDVRSALKRGKTLIVAGFSKKSYKQIMTKLSDALEPVQTLIDKLEKDNPKVFGS